MREDAGLAARLAEQEHTRGSWVRANALFVERYAKANAWHQLTPEARQELETQVGDLTHIELPQVTAGLNMAKFKDKDKARVLLREQEIHPSLPRLRRNADCSSAGRHPRQGCGVVGV